MAQQGNPFFVDPSAGAQGLLGITQSLGQNIGGAIQAHKQRGIEQEFRDAAIAKDYDKMLEISSTNPQFQQFAMRQAGIADEKQRQATAKGYMKLLASKDPEQRKAILTDMADEITMLGGDAGDVLELMGSELDPDQNTDEIAKVSLLAIAPETYRQMYPRQQQLADRRTTDERNWDRYQELRKDDPKAAEEFKSQFLQGGLGTLEERTKAGIEAAGGEERAKTTAERRQGYIESGVEAADSLIDLRRTLELARQINTGGIQSIKQDAFNFLGIEGYADEGELRNLMGVAVLQQLKPTFGAAFTNAEGQRLERLMADFSKSKTTNVRLLEKAIEIAERAVKRSLRAAEEEGNDFEANEIRRAAGMLEDVRQTGQQKQPSTEWQTTESGVKFRVK
jgi:hypothetical protein